MMFKEVILILLIATINGKETIYCRGDDVSKLPDTCRSIDLKPLKIAGNVNDSIVRSKLKQITKITSGVEVTDTEISTFDFLPNVEILTNNNGPAFKFSKNKKLARIIMPKLKQLKGKEEAVLFDHDQFLTNAQTQKKGMQDFFELKAVAKDGNEKYTCSNFAKVVKEDTEDGNPNIWMFFVSVVSFLWTCVGGWFLYEKWRRTSKNGEAKENSA